MSLRRRKVAALVSSRDEAESVMDLADELTQLFSDKCKGDDRNHFLALAIVVSHVISLLPLPEDQDEAHKLFYEMVGGILERSRGGEA